MKTAKIQWRAVVLAGLIVMGVTSALMLKTEAQTWQPPANSPLQKKEHPRLYFTSATRINLVNKIKTFYKNDYQKFVQTLDGVYGQAFQSGSSQNLRINDVRNFAFLCQINPGEIGIPGKSRNEYCKEAVRLTKEMASQLSGYTDSIHCGQNWGGEDCGLFNVSLAVAYDWTYHDTSPEDQAIIRGALEESFKRKSDDANGDREMLMNKATTDALHGAFPFLAIYGDGSSIESEMKTWFETYFIKGMLEVGDRLFSGSAYHHEGDTYSGDVFVPLTLMATAASPALGENLVENHPYLKGFLDYFYYTIIPQRSPWGNGYAGERNNTHSNGYTWMPNDMPYLVINGIGSAIAETDPEKAGFAKWLSEGPSPYALGSPENAPYYNIRRHDLFTKFLWGTKQIPESLDPVESKQPLGKFLGGEYVIRSSHDPETATRIAFHANEWNYPQGHNDPEYTAVGVWKYGPLILDSVGNSKNTKDMRKVETSKGPAMNSTLALFSPSQIEKDGYNMMNFTPVSTSEKDANNPQMYVEGSPLDVGDFSYESTSGYDYGNYDHSKLYKGGSKAQSARRELIYIRGNENSEYLVLYDRAASNLEKRLTFHSAVDWQAAQGNWQEAENGFKKLTNSDNTVKITNTSLQSGNGTLFLKIVSPQGAEIYKSGGPDYPWIDATGKKIAISSGSGVYEYECFSIGCHRIQVRTLAPNVLTAMQFGKAATLGNMAETTRIEGGEAEGVQIGNAIVMFAKQNNTNLASLGYTITSSGITNHIIANVTPNTNFKVSNGKNTKSTLSTKQGILSFSDDATGTHVISIGGGAPPPQDTTPPEVINFDVNPITVTDSVTVSWLARDENALKQVEIWRAKDENDKPVGWSAYKILPVSGKNHEGEWIDRSPLEGKSWYGIHAIDENNNWAPEPTPPGPKQIKKQETPQNQPPQAIIGATPKDGITPLVVNFVGSNSYDPDGEVISYNWEFGDNTGTDQINPTHTYTQEGTYTVFLTVTDNKGATSKVSVLITAKKSSPPPRTGNVIYVDSMASESGNGSENSPYKTIQEALNNVESGNTITIRGNNDQVRIYKENITVTKDGTPQSPITIKASDNEQVTISHSKTIEVSKNWLKFINLNFNHESQPTDAIKISGENIIFENVQIWNGKRDGLDFTSSARNILIKKSDIHNFTWQIGQDAHCIVLDSGVENFTLESSTVYNCGGDGIQLYAEDATDPQKYSKNITISENRFWTTQPSQSENAIDVKGVHGMTIRNNEMYGYANKAVVFQKGPTNVKFVKNKIKNSNRGLEIRQEGGHTPSDFEIINNLFYDITGQYALKLDGVTNAKVQHNTIANIKGNGIRIEGGGVISSAIQNNLIADTGAQSATNLQNTTLTSNGWFGKAKPGPLESPSDTQGENAGFVNAENKNFRLTSDSPAINTGTIIDSIISDFEGNVRPQAGGYDLGAYESGTAAPPPPKPKPQIFITKKANVTEAKTSDVITYTLEYSNPSPSKAINIIIKDGIPVKTVYVSNSATGGGYFLEGENLVEWDIPEINPGEFGSLSFQVVVSAE